MQSNTYQQHTGPSVASHKNASHLSEKEKEALSSLMSNFEGLLKGTVGDYKKMEVSFEVDKNKTPYHAKPYRIPVAHTKMMNTTINEMCENKALEEYSGDSEWVAPTLACQKRTMGYELSQTSANSMRPSNETHGPCQRYRTYFTNAVA